MDYSATLNEADSPSGVSPWHSSPTSPPEDERTPFGGFNADNHEDNGFAAPADGGGFTASNIGFRQPEPAVKTAYPEQSDPKDYNDEPHPSGEQAPLFDGQQRSQAAPTQQPTEPEQAAAVQQQQQRRQHQQQFRKPQQPQYRLQAKITGLERTGRKDPILRFDVHTNSPSFRTTQYRDVRRLHSEFVKLAEHLISANPDAIVPTVPPPLTSAGAGTDEDEARVKALMQRWFNYVCSNKVLMRDDEMLLFVESDFGYSPMMKKKQPATGVRRKIIKQFAPPPDDTPELADARPIVKMFYLGSMDAGHKVDRLVKSRRGLSLAESDFGVKLGSMHIQEPHQGLSNAYRRLGKVIQTVGDLHAAQATAEATTISDPLQYHSQDAFVVKETLTNRQILMRELIQAQEHTRSKLHAADRVRTSTNVRHEKVNEAIAAHAEALRIEGELLENTRRVTQRLVHERRKWFARTSADLRLSIREFVMREIEAERRTLALLESVRPDVRAIDGSGGLSRLGRESHPIGRRTNLAASQGPKGDAWSGIPRRSDATSRTIPGALIAGLPGDLSTGDGAAGGRILAPGGVLAEEDDEDRVDAKNAASRLAASTF